MIFLAIAKLWFSLPSPSLHITEVLMKSVLVNTVIELSFRKWCAETLVSLMKVGSLNMENDTSMVSSVFMLKIYFSMLRNL